MRKPMWRGVHTSRRGNTREGRLLDKGFIYRIITNPVYLGVITHKGEWHQGQHAPIINREVWDQVCAIMSTNYTARGNHNKRKTSAALLGLIRCGGCNSGMTATATQRRGKHYSYYTPSAHMKKSCLDCPVGNVSAGEMDGVVLQRIQGMFTSPEVIAETYRHAQQSSPEITIEDVRRSLGNIMSVWDELFPQEQQRIMRQVVREIVLKPDGMQIFLHDNNLSGLIEAIPLRMQTNAEAAAWMPIKLWISDQNQKYSYSLLSSANLQHHKTHS